MQFFFRPPNTHSSYFVQQCADLFNYQVFNKKAELIKAFTKCCTELTELYGTKKNASLVIMWYKNVRDGSPVSIFPPIDILY